MEEFITVATFHYPHEITILKHRLALDGIRHIFENEAMMNIVPMYSIALGGIKLKVHPDDRLAAEAIVIDLNNSNDLKIV